HEGIRKGCPRKHAGGMFSSPWPGRSRANPFWRIRDTFMVSLFCAMKGFERAVRSSFQKRTKKRTKIISGTVRSPYFFVSFRNGTILLSVPCPMILSLLHNFIFIFCAYYAPIFLPDFVRHANSLFARHLL
ncbi:MAG: hypothetical protein SPJ01_00190, partial [Butyricicoccus sp.]|nr:hypothetical protein [Butyricicoccus sp.]